MSGELTPKQAAVIAAKVYDVKDDSAWAEKVESGPKVVNKELGVDGLFSLDTASSRFTGTSGGVFLRARSGFGYIAQGVGVRANEVLVAVRGTASGYDGITDLVQSVTRGPSGYSVHAGFMRTFDSFKPTIANLARGTKPTTVHVIGHSLGGALASIVADFLTEHSINTKLYTFGCPRVGFEGFARNLGQKMGVQNMFRVHHAADIVSMVPIFPFAHTPIGRDEYALPWNGASISVNAHFMANYINSVGQMDWDGLIRTAPGPGNWQQAEDWLKEVAKNGGTAKMLSAGTLWMLMKSIDWIVSLIAGGTEVVAGLTALGAVTVMDRLAQLMYQGALTSVQVGTGVMNLMKAILRFLGRTIVATVSLTVQFISWVLQMLYNVVSQMALTAMQRLF